MTTLLRFSIPVFTLGGVIFWWASRRVSSAVRRERWIKFATYVVIVHAMVLTTALGPLAIRAVVSLITLLGAWELVRLAPRLRSGVAIGVLATFAMLAAGAIRLTTVADPPFVAYVYVIVATFDGFGQAIGQLIGRTKLAPSVSPGKTVEGFMAGAILAVGCAILLRGVGPVSKSRAVVIGVCAAVAGLAGDLSASWVKRRAGVKDYGTILPGHGGVLDRFDSFLTVAALLSVVTTAAW